MALSRSRLYLDPTDAGLPRAVPAERRADAVLHVLGLALGLVACATLAAPATPRAEPALRAALALYAAGLVAVFACSALYNLAPGGRRQRDLFRRLDQAAIFLLIAGTHTPFALLAGGGGLGAGLLTFVWAAAATGAAAKLAGLRGPEWLTTGTYLLLGWSAAAMLGPLSAALPPAGLGLLVAGGALYSLGVVFHLQAWLPYRAAVWHGFVLAAAACHYGAVREVAALAAAAG
jgi:hemolysin III